MRNPLRAAFILLAVVALAGVTFSQTQTFTPTVEQLQATIKALQDEIRSLKETIAQLRGTQKTEPAQAVPPISRAKQARLAYADGRKLEDQKLSRAALDAFSESIQLDPLNDAAFLHRGYCFQQLGDYAAAAADFTQALALQPHNSRAYLARAAANAAMGLRAPALDDVDEAIRRDPRSTESYLLRGRLLQQQGDSQRALGDFAAAQSLAPNLEQPYLGRAETNLRDGKPNDAMADCDSAVRINANSFAAYLCRAQAYIQLGKSERAIEEVGRASRVAQSLDLPLAFLTETWQALEGRPAPTPRQTLPDSVPAKRLEQESATVTAAASASSPTEGGSAAALERFGRSYIDQHNYAGAFVLLNRSIALDPTRPTAYNSRGFVHLRLKHFDQAIADFSDAIRLNPAYSNAYHNRAVTLRAVGELRRAAQDDERANEFGSRQLALTARR